MLEVSKTLEELDNALEELEQLVQCEKIQNEGIRDRILKKELWLKSFEMEQYQEECN